MSITGSDIPEWTLISGFAIRTRSVLTAARIARKLTERGQRTRQKGTLEGVEWCCLARWHEEHADAGA